MRIQIGLLLLPLLLLCDRSAAGSFNQSSVGAESEPRGEVTDDIRLRKEKPNEISHLDRSATNWTSNSSRADFPCPDAAAIAPCVCTVDGDYNIDLDCTFVESEEQLATVFQQEFPVKELYKFSMANNSAIRVLGNILNGVKFESIELYPGPFVLNQVNEYFIFDSKDSLTSIEIQNSQLTSDQFPFTVLSQMNNLDSFSIYISSLSWIPPILAPKLSYLRLVHGLTDIIEAGTFSIHEWGTYLHLYYNQIAAVEPGSFFFSDENSAASSGYLIINLNDNKIQSLQAETFPFRNSVVHLYLCNNLITSIEPETFVLPGTTESFSLVIWLYNNQLTTFDEAVFGDLMPFVTDLRLYDNPLSCGCDIAWLVLNSELLGKIDEDATCADGSNLHDLDPQFYVEFC